VSIPTPNDGLTAATLRKNVDGFGDTIKTLIKKWREVQPETKPAADDRSKPAR